MTALVLAPFSQDALCALRRLMPVIHRSWHDSRKLHSPEELVREIIEQQVQALVVEADFVFEEVLQASGCLRFVGVCRSAPHHVDVETATRHGVAVAYTPHRNTVAVAELTLGLMLSLARGLPRLNDYVKSGEWQDPVGPYIEMRGQELRGRTLGIIGVGAIGQAVARLARGVGMRVVGHDPLLAAARRQKRGVPLLGLERLLQQSDYVSLHVASREPGGMMVLDGQRMAMMKQGARLINTSLPSAIDESALLRQLNDGRLAGAALDVHDTHPRMPGSPLLGHDKVLLTPHVGGATEETVRRHSWMMVRELRRFVRGQRPLCLANPEVWGRRV